VTRVVGLGAGGHASVVIETLRLMGGFDVAALLDRRVELHGRRVAEVEVVGGDEMLTALAGQGIRHAFVGVGGVETAGVRARLYRHLTASGFEVVTARHPSAIVSGSARVGAGATIMAGAVVNAAAVIGANVIVNTAAVVEHDCVLGDHVHIASGATLAGGVRVGDGALVGLGACVRQGLSIGRGAIVGAGAVVVADVADGVVVVGSPATGRIAVQTRIIPRLDIKGPNLVKGIHLEGLRVLGRPEAFARFYDDQGADELIYVDVVASLYGRNSLFDIIRRTSAAVFIPLTVGGGLRTVDDIRDALRAGADKVTINTAAVANPSLIRDASRRFGSSTIVVAVEAIETAPGRYEVFTDNGRQATGLDAVEWARRAVELGAGEVLLTSVDREGTGRGFDLTLVRAVAETVAVPVIASGGAGQVDHVAQVLADGRADAVALGSLLHYHAIDHIAMPGADPSEGNTEYLRGARPAFSRVRPAAIAAIADRLSSSGFETRATTTRQLRA
jgi:cyclase